MRRIVIATGLTLLAALPLATQELAAQETPVAELVGEGTTNSRPFVVEGPWEIQWTAEGYFSVTVFEVPAAGAEPVYVQRAVLNEDGGVGASYMPTGGRFYLEIRTTGNWTVNIVAVP